MEGLRVDRDENSMARTQRRMAACLVKTLNDVHPELENVHSRKDFRKGRVSVFANGEPLCSLVPKAPTIARVFFYWNRPQLTTLELDKEKIIDAVLPMFERPEDKVEWCL